MNYNNQYKYITVKLSSLNLYSTKHRNNLNIQIKMIWCT